MVIPREKRTAKIEKKWEPGAGLGASEEEILARREEKEIARRLEKREKELKTETEIILEEATPLVGRRAETLWEWQKKKEERWKKLEEEGKSALIKREKEDWKANKSEVATDIGRELAKKHGGRTLKPEIISGNLEKGIGIERRVESLTPELLEKSKSYTKEEWKEELEGISEGVSKEVGISKKGVEMFDSSYISGRLTQEMEELEKRQAIEEEERIVEEAYQQPPEEVPPPGKEEE